MSGNIDDLLPTAKEIQRQAALQAAEKAEQYARTQAAIGAEKRKLIERLSKPSGLSEDEKVELASTIIRRAVKWADRGPGLPLPPHAVHRQRPRHQSAGAGLGKRRSRE